MASVSAFFMRQIDWLVLASILFIKMYWFANEIGLDFLRKNMIMVSIGSILLLFMVGFLFNRVNRLIVLTILSFIATVVIYADLVYFRYFGDFLTTPVLKQSAQVSDISSSITELMVITDTKYFIDIFLLVTIIVLLKIKNVHQSIRWIEKLVMMTLMLGVGLYLVITPIKQYTDQYGKNLFVNTWSNVSIYNQIGHLGFHVFETQKYVREHVLNSPVIDDERKQELQGWFEQNKSPHLEHTEFFGLAKDMNIMLIQLESFQNYVIHRSINGQEITPNLNKLTSDSLYFSNFYHQVAQGRTSDAEFIVNNSLYPLSTGSVYVRYPTNHYDSLPLFFGARGYYTSVFHSFDKSFWNRTTVYNNYGFDDFVGKGDFEEGQIAGPFQSLGDEGVFVQMVEMTKEKQPFYNFVVALTSHHPYTGIPAEYRTLPTVPFDGTIFAEYLHSIHYVDHSIGVLIEEMKKQGLWDNTVLVFYGDHDSGIEFTPEHAKALGIDDDPITLLTIRDKVPLFIRVPNVEANLVREYQHSASMVDLTPTLLHLFGVEEEAYHLGRNLLTFEDQLVPFRYGSFKKGDIYYKAALDGIFENGTAYDTAVKKEVDINLYRKEFEKAREFLRKSDDVIYHDLIEQFRREAVK